MTMHDDSNVRLLERDLKRLAEPREEDERIRVAVREQLGAKLNTRAPRWRLPMRIALGSTAVTAAAVTIALVTFVGTTESGGPSAADAAIIHHALDAVTPPANEILHLRVVGGHNGVPIAAESWQQTSAPYAARAVKGEVGHQGEFADNGTTSFQYDPSTNTIYEQPERPLTPFTDPVSQIRQELASGQATSVATVVIDGTSLFKIYLPHGMVGYFGTRDFRPRYLDDPQRDGSVLRLTIAAYEYLPMTPSNRALLSVTAQHPTARIVVSANGGSST
jgi:hypothetical protein